MSSRHSIHGEGLMILKTLPKASLLIVLFASVLMVIAGCTEEPITNVYIEEPTDSYTLTGRVVSLPGGEPVAGATYSLPSGSQTGTCDQDGYFKVANLSAGTYQVVVSATGYATSRVYMAMTTPLNKDNINHFKDFYLLENSSDLQLTVRSQDLGEVLHGVTVEVVAAEFPEGVYGHQIDPSSLTSTGQTDENGQVTLTGLPASGVWIAARAFDVDGDDEPDYGTQTSRFLLQAEGTTSGHLVMPTYTGDAPSIVATNLPEAYGSAIVAPSIYFIFSVPMQTSGSTTVSLTEDNYPYEDIPLTATWTSDVRLEVTPIEPLANANMDYDFRLTANSEDGLPFSYYRNNISWQTGTDPVGGDCEEVVTDLVAEDPTGAEIDYDTTNIMLTWSAVPCSGGYRIYASDNLNNPQWVYIQDEPTDYEAGIITTVCTLPSTFDRYDVDGIQTPFAGTEVTFCVVPMQALISTPGDPHGTAMVMDETAPAVPQVLQIDESINNSDGPEKLEFRVLFSEFIDPAVADPVFEVTEAGGDPAFALDPAGATWIWNAGRFSGRFVFELPAGADASGDNFRVTITDLADLSGNTITGPVSTSWQTMVPWGGNFDFENSPQGWTQSGPGWAWGTPTIGPGGAHSGLHCWALALDSAYGDNWITDLFSPQLVVPGSDPILTFWCWYELDSYDDYVNVYASNGVNEIALESFNGYSSEWTEVSFSLSQFAGQEIYLRFNFTSDSYGTYSGFFLDDVIIEVGGN
jgi:hypothetical protein